MGLIEGIADDCKAVVVESDGHSTTYECLISAAAIQRAVGENVVGDGGFPKEPGRQTRIVVDAAGLPSRIEPDDQDYPFKFSGWGTTPRVVPPDAPTMDWVDWEISSYGSRSED